MTILTEKYRYTFESSWRDYTVGKKVTHLYFLNNPTPEGRYHFIIIDYNSNIVRQLRSYLTLQHDGPLFYLQARDFLDKEDFDDYRAAMILMQLYSERETEEKLMVPILRRN